MAVFEVFNKDKMDIKDELLSGITVALALVPEAIAFAFVMGVSPIIGLHAAFMMAVITAVFGGRPGMISGATGAIAVVFASLVIQHGVEYLFAAIFLMGILQMLAGIFKLGKFARMIPHPVMIGFVNGLAIVIFLAQMKDFKVNGHWLTGMPLMVMLSLILLSMAIIYFLPKLTKAIPSTLVAIIVVTLVSIFLVKQGFFIQNVQQYAGMKLHGGFPKFHIPMVPLNFQTLSIILPYSFIGALVGLIESLLTLTLIDDITSTRGKGNRECFGQGLGNFVNGMFGGMGGCAMIGQSMINIKSGGRTRISSLVAGLGLLFFIMIGSPIIELIAIPALVGVMFMVVIGTFEWGSFTLGKSIPKRETGIIVVVTLVTVFFNLATAVIVGIILSALKFAWKKGKEISATTYIANSGTKVYQLQGTIFFASVENFKRIFTPKEDPKKVVIEFKQAQVMDHSAIEAINSITEKYRSEGKLLLLRYLSRDCVELLENARDIIEVNIDEDPRYYVAHDKLA